MTGLTFSFLQSKREPSLTDTLIRRDLIMRKLISLHRPWALSVLPSLIRLREFPLSTSKLPSPSEMSSIKTRGSRNFLSVARAQ
jgi:hypothetical protein